MGKKTGKLFRISQPAIDAIKRFATTFHKTETDIVDELVIWASKLDERHLAMAFSGTGINFLDEIADDVRDLAWGEHAFFAGPNFATWTFQEYYRVNRRSEARPGVFQFTTYRIAYCWANIARLLREEAVDSIDPEQVDDPAKLAYTQWDSLFQLADDALRLAIAHNEVLLEVRPHPVVRYNVACEHAMRGQFYLEHALIELLRNSDAGAAAWAKEILTDLFKSHTAIERMCREWPDHLDRAATSILSVCGEHCLDNLLKLMGEATSMNEWIDVSFFRRHAESHEVDLSFVKFHPEYSNKFRTWIEMLSKQPLSAIFPRLSAFGMSNPKVAKRFNDTTSIYMRQ